MLQPIESSPENGQNAAMTDNVLVYDCFSGISGDMHIGAMLDIGVPEPYLRGELERLEMADEFELIVERATKLGISGTLATIRLAKPSHHHRHLHDIERIIDTAGFSPAVRDRAIAIFRHIAIAEAHVHGTSIDQVHFHEVGATDSIADIVAAAICLDYLKIDEAYCMTLELGGGMVRCEHGLMPVPAPATAEILKDVACRYGGVDQEATTPTGAAILKHAVERFEAPKDFQANRVGYGLGQKDFALPNVVRVMLGTKRAATEHGFYRQEQNLQIECNIDDMSPEAFQPLLDALFAGGARDVFLTPIIMKKSRPGTRLTLLCDSAQRDELLAIVFKQSTSIGVRTSLVEKFMLPRETRSVSTSLGNVDVKLVQLEDGVSRWKLEHDQVVAVADAARIDYLSARAKLEAEVAELLDPKT